jgi:hypothetical protein
MTITKYRTRLAISGLQASHSHPYLAVSHPAAPEGTSSPPKGRRRRRRGVAASVEIVLVAGGNVHDVKGGVQLPGMEVSEQPQGAPQPFVASQCSCSALLASCSCASARRHGVHHESAVRVELVRGDVRRPVLLRLCLSGAVASDRDRAVRSHVTCCTAACTLLFAFCDVDCSGQISEREFVQGYHKVSRSEPRNARDTTRAPNTICASADRTSVVCAWA